MNQTIPIISTPPFLAEDADPSGDGVSLDAELRHLVVPVELHGQRVDSALAAMVTELSRSYLQQLLESGAALINGKTAQKMSQRVKAGDLVDIEIRPTQQSQAFKPELIPLNVVYSDAHLRVIDKPAGLVVHPAPGHWSGTLLNGLLALDAGSALLPRAGIVHRLDKDTSGLMVVARSRAAMDALVQAIAARSVSRQYLALAHRPWHRDASVVVDLPIGRDTKNRLRMAVVDLDRSPGKAARTDVEWIGNSAVGCFVRCILHTGRTHQIRVHMASLGHPLLADSLYGGVAGQGMLRQALHAFRLAFAHPLTGAPMVFESLPPADFEGVLRAWSLRYNAASRPGGG
ncbi:MAG: RluA family pseudouridine synthase [Rhodoferax sp.]|nr:RluA family pseudouridine synthase [Rhodoferax sp.]